MRDTVRESADGCDGQLAGGDRLGGPGRQVPVEVGAGMPVLVTISAMVCPAVCRWAA